MNNRIYDIIVYGASPAGTAFAVRRAAAGASVLLLNGYGFPGGDITEALNCMQFSLPPQSGTLTEQIVNEAVLAIAPSAKAFPDAVVLNPETVKIILQRALTQSALDLLFHIQPRRIHTDASGIGSIELIAAEGPVTVRGAQIFDATYDGDLAILGGWTRSIAERRVHCFTTPFNGTLAVPAQRLLADIPLADGRHWLSLALTADDALFSEPAAQELLDQIGAVLAERGSRIQLVPARSTSVPVLAPQPGAQQQVRLLAELYENLRGPADHLRALTAVETRTLDR